MCVLFLFLEEAFQQAPWVPRVEVLRRPHCSNHCAELWSFQDSSLMVPSLLQWLLAPSG